MILYFLRHASAGEPVSNPKKDEKRALDETGIEQCGYVGRALAALDAQVDIIISSPLKRAAQTASLVGNEMGYEGKLQLEDALRPTPRSRISARCSTSTRSTTPSWWWATTRA